MKPLFELRNYHPLYSFFIYGITLSIIITFAFLIDDEIDRYIRFRPHKERVKIKSIVHFFTNLVGIFLVFTVSYYFFGIGTNLFPLCSYKKFCSN